MYIWKALKAIIDNVKQKPGTLKIKILITYAMLLFHIQATIAYEKAGPRPNMTACPTPEVYVPSIFDFGACSSTDPLVFAISDEGQNPQWSTNGFGYFTYPNEMATQYIRAEEDFSMQEPLEIYFSLDPMEEGQAPFTSTSTFLSISQDVAYPPEMELYYLTCLPEEGKFAFAFEYYEGCSGPWNDYEPCQESYTLFLADDEIIGHGPSSGGFLYTAEYSDVEKYSIIMVDISGGVSHCTSVLTVYQPDCNPQIETETDLFYCSETNSAQLSASTQEGLDLIWTTQGDGSFSTSTGDSSTYTFGPMDLELGEVVINVGPEVYQDAEQINITILDPIIWDYNEQCNENTGTYTLVMQATGGFPSYDSQATYMISGDYNSNNIADGQSFTIVSNATPNATVYNFTATDALGCTALEQIEVNCHKLPIELLSFTGYARELDNYLEWHSSSEYNLADYTLERSLDGRNWEPIERILAQGSSSQNYYSVSDKQISASSYYRLSWKDSEVTQYSQVVQIDRWNEHEKPQVLQTHQQLKILNANSLISCQLIDALGSSQSYAITPNTEELLIDASHLPSGVYILLLQTRSGQQSSKMLLQ